MKPPAGLTARRLFWAEHVQAWRNSGMTQVAYCEQHKINTKSFGYWFRSRELENETLTILPIAVREVATASELKLRHPSGWELILPCTIDPAWLAHLLQEMR